MQEDFDEAAFTDGLDAVVRFRGSLNGESDRGCGLMAGAYLDDRLGDLISKTFIDDKNAAEEMLGVNGPLGTFSSRIDCAYLLGLIGPDARRDLHLIRKIRNDFGHKVDPINFEYAPIAGRCRELKCHAKLPNDPPRGIYIQTAMGLLGVIQAAGCHVVKPAKPVEDSVTDEQRRQYREEMDRMRGPITPDMREWGTPPEAPDQKS